MSEKIFINKTAKDLFPALFKEIKDDTLIKVIDEPPQQQTKFTPRNIPPKPPDVNWLRTEVIDDKSEKEVNIPRALILTDNTDNIPTYITVLKNLGYAIEYTHIEAAAIKSVSSILYSIVLYENSLKFRNFEHFMDNLSSTKRRNLFYIIVGPDLRTLYDLEALCLSANIVINSSDIASFNLILKKGFKDYETLYGPFLDILESVRGSRYS